MPPLPKKTARCLEVIVEAGGDVWFVKNDSTFRPRTDLETTLPPGPVEDLVSRRILVPCDEDRATIQYELAS